MLLQPLTFFIYHEVKAFGNIDALACDDSNRRRPRAFFRHDCHCEVRVCSSFCPIRNVENICTTMYMKISIVQRTNKVLVCDIQVAQGL